MSSNLLLYYATDKEIFDLILSSKQRITEGILLGLGRDRGLFYSPKEPRESLASFISLLPHGQGDLQTLLDLRENVGRGEKLTSVNIKGSITLDEIKAVCSEYREQPPPDEVVTTHSEGANKYVMKVGYTDLDYGKTRLLQRRSREAEIEFVVRDDETTIRMPANPKAREIAGALKSALDARHKAELPTEAIELTDLKSPETRTEFFTLLISSLTSFRLENVTSIRVDSSLNADDVEDDLDSQNREEDPDAVDPALRIAEQRMLSIVENVALKGHSLLASPEYQQLKAKGFHTTYVIWRSKQTERPYSVYEFEAGFEEPKTGKAFKYNVRGVQRYVNGQYTATLRPVTKEEKASMLTLLEVTAHTVLGRLRQDAQSGSTGPPQEALP